MTVLRKDEMRGFSTGPIRKFVVGAAMAGAGIAAAFGLSQVIDTETTVETGLTAVERNAVAQAHTAAVESAERVDQALIARYLPPAEFTLADELAALHSDGTVTAATEFTLADELAAIKAPAPVSSPITVSQSGPR